MRQELKKSQSAIVLDAPASGAAVPAIKLKKGKIWLVALKWVIFFLTGWYLYARVLKSDEILNLERSTFSLIASGERLFYFVSAAALLFFNWGIEALKWKFLLRKFQKISFSIAFG